jgi:hypothetical protein
MHNDEKELPGELLEWLERMPFKGLDEEQRSIVLNSMNADEYDQLYAAAARAGAAASLLIHERAHKDRIFEAFDAKHASEGRVVSFLKSPVAMWKAAAASVTLLMLSALSFYLSGSALTPKVITLHDTVYYSAPSQPPAMAESAINPAAEILSAGNERVKTNYTTRIVTAVPEQMNVVTPADFNAPENALKGNSLKDDSLALHFEYITL